MKKICLISHDTAVQESLETMVHKLSHEFVHYADTKLALADLEAHGADAIVLDERMPVDMEALLLELAAYDIILLCESEKAEQQGYPLLTLPVRESSFRLKLGQIFEKHLRQGRLDLHNLRGKQVGHYQIQQRLGEETLNTVVYRARDTLHNRDVALKFFSNVKAEESIIKRFKREANIAKKLEHKNIYKVYGLEQLDNGILYMVMEFIEGQTLKDIISQQRLSFKQIIDYTRQMAEGLAAAHEQKITHRDMKPSNVMLMPDGVIKIVDFGVAKALEPTTSLQEELTKHGMILGTMRYMAPEQIEGQAVDARADCWALGVMLYEMLKGEHPFDHTPGILGLINAILYQEPAPLGLDVPPLLEEMLEDLLQKDAERRYPSAWEVLEDLEELEL